MNVIIVDANTDMPAATASIMWKLTELSMSVTFLLLCIQNPQISVDPTSSKEITDNIMCSTFMTSFLSMI
jgi:hypothetical protein